MIIIDGETKEEFNFKVKPHEKAIIEEEALNVGGVTLEQIQSYDDMLTVYIKIIEMLEKYVDKFNKADKFHLCGYNNAAFDNQFFRAFFTQMNDKYFGSWFWSDSIDVFVLASNYLKSKRNELNDFKLATVAEYLGIKVDREKTHDAIYDIKLTHDIFKVIENNKGI
jgi:DNA polymerase-3 subunit epsilon